MYVKFLIYSIYIYMVKIFSSFDTKLDDKLLAKAQKEYWKDHVCFIRRDPIYLIIKVITPLVWWLIFIGLWVILAYGIDLWDGLQEILQRMIWIMIVISGLRLSSYATIKIIDYYMDFTIITPKNISTFDQTWIFDRATRTLDISKIKSISVDKKGISRSLFNYGSIIFFAEWDASFGDIRLNYINNPASLEKRIVSVMNFYNRRRRDIEKTEHKPIIS